MSKVSTCLHMLCILSTGRLYSISELAALLDASPRNIINYKNDLNVLGKDVGFYIDPVYGPGGGYKLYGDFSIPIFKLKDEEKEVLLEAYNYLLSKKDFAKKPLFTESFSKLFMFLNAEDKNKDVKVVDKYQLSMDEKDIRVRYDFIEKAIKEQRKVELEYESLKNGLKTHVLDPYTLFIYNNSWFFTAWYQEAGKVCYFKVNRIKEFKMLDKKFVVKRDYNWRKFFDEVGLTYNGDYHHIELISSGVRTMLFKERIYGKNQVVTELEDGTAKVSLDMQNEDAIVSFILGCGLDVKVLEPEWLKEKVKDITLEINKKY